MCNTWINHLSFQSSFSSGFRLFPSTHRPEPLCSLIAWFKRPCVPQLFTGVSLYHNRCERTLYWKTTLSRCLFSQRSATDPVPSPCWVSCAGLWGGAPSGNTPRRVVYEKRREPPLTSPPPETPSPSSPVECRCWTGRTSAWTCRWGLTLVTHSPVCVHVREGSCSFFVLVCSWSYR